MSRDMAMRLPGFQFLHGSRRIVDEILLRLAATAACGWYGALLFGSSNSCTARGGSWEPIMVQSRKANPPKVVLARHRGSGDRSDGPWSHSGTVQSVDLRQCGRGASWRNVCSDKNLASRIAMLTQRIKFLVAGLFAGLALLLPPSGPGVARDLVRDGDAAVTNRNAARPVNATAVRRDALPIEASVGEGARHNVSLAKVAVAKFVPRDSSLETVLASGSSHSMSCDRGIACGGCGANAGCCGMSCCVTALAVNARTLPNADGHALTISASEQFRAANFGTLFRPPRALA